MRAASGGFGTLWGGLHLDYKIHGSTSKICECENRRLLEMGYTGSLSMRAQRFIGFCTIDVPKLLPG
jgi:hypothetical protein